MILSRNDIRRALACGEVDIPDLAVILTVEPDVAAQRIAWRGAHSRFEAGLATSITEHTLYTQTITRLPELGYPLLVLDSTTVSALELAETIAEHVSALRALGVASCAG